jgi:dolichyl-phosphate beta-glucosyltransferase
MNEKIDISIVIPAFNEVNRLPVFLEKVISWCKNSSWKYEIIVVDDGSIDKTFEVAALYRDKFSNFEVVRIRKNRGKGYAVKRGLLRSSGEICLFLDADGSVGPEEIGKNIHYILKKGHDIFVGSRVLRSKEQVLKVRLHRKLIGLAFNFFVQTFLLKNIKDTQCGFKMFRKEIVRPLFSRSYLRGFGFDIEMLYLAHKMGYKVKEGPVSWQHVTGSKVNLITDSIKIFFNILQIRNWHCTPINPRAKYMGPDEYRYMYDLEEYHWWFVSRRNLIISMNKSLDISSPSILDIGCGTGGNLQEFAKLGNSFGLDASMQAVEFCKKRGLKNVIECSAEKIAYRDNTFDVITCLDVLEHLPDPVEALREMKRVLKDSGKIIITVPAFRILWSQHDDALGHLRRYERESLICDLTEAGFQIEKMGFLYFLSFFAVAPIRLIRKFLVPGIKLRSDTTTLPPKPLNEFMKFLFNIEIRLSRKFGLPFGTTLYAVACKEE